MIKTIYRTLVILITLFLMLAVFLSIFGIKTDKFNSQIISQIKKIEPNLEIKINEVSATINLFNFEINAKTIGTDLIYRNKTIKLESIKSKISLKSLLNKRFSFTEISISTKSLKIKDLITFIRLFNNDPKLFIAEQFIKNGYVVADLKLGFDEQGNITNDYKINGFINDGKVSLFKRFNLNKINFIFEINEKDLKFNDIKLSLNNKNILLPELIVSKNNNKYLISGKLNTPNVNLTKNDISNLSNEESLRLNIEKILFSSKNTFQFEINKNLKVKNLDIKSDIELDNLKINNPVKLKNIFPKIKKNIVFQNQKIILKYEKDSLSIDGKGEVFLQNEIDKIEYKIYKKKDEIKFNTTLNILKNPFEIDLLNYKKKKNLDLVLNFKGRNSNNKELIFDEISLKEKNNLILIKNLILSNTSKIIDIDNIDINYVDESNIENILQIKKKDKDYLISGRSFSVDNIIEKLIDSENEKNV